jgi:hypothetical protein
LMWFILIPKTLAKIITDPGWVPGYVTKELKQEGAARFDDYISPVLLFLLASLLPYAVINTLPSPGVIVEGPTEGTVGEPYDFKAEANFIWTFEPEYTFEWYGIDENNQQYELIEPLTYAGYDNTAQDTVGLSWDVPGLVTVFVYAMNDVGEVYTTTHPVYIFDPGIPVDTTPVQIDTKPTGKGFADIGNALKGEKSLLAGLIFLSFPLFFTLATEIPRVRSLSTDTEGFSDGLAEKIPRTQGFSGSTLQRMFYVQCYLFTPVFLAFWVEELTYTYFYIPGRHDRLYDGTIFLLLGMFLWFIIAETGVIKKERDTSIFKSLVIVFITLFVMTLAAFFGFIFATDPDTLRDIAWWGYLLVIPAMLLIALVRRFRIRKKQDNNETDPAEEMQEST